MFAGQIRAACRGLSTFPPVTHSHPFVAIAASDRDEVPSLCHHGHLENRAFAPSSQSLRPGEGRSPEPVEGPLACPESSRRVTRHCLRPPNRHTLAINFPRNSSAINESSHSNRHMKRHNDYASWHSLRGVRRSFLRVALPLHISNVKATMDDWAWWTLHPRLIPANRGFSVPRLKDFHSRYPWTSTQRSL